MRTKRETHNSDPVLKLELRRRFMEKVEARLCFDLFCGTGTYLQALYLPHFERCVAVDKQRKSLELLPDADNLMVYQGNNAELAPRLCYQYGFPDYIDLDAFGNPDAPLVALLPWARDKQRFAVIGTDGTMNARKSFTDIPSAWGHGKAKWSPSSLRLCDWPAMILQHLRDWTAEHGLRVADYEYHRLALPSKMLYWGALIERDE